MNTAIPELCGTSALAMARAQLTRLERVCMRQSALHYEVFGYNFSVAADAVLAPLSEAERATLIAEFPDYTAPESAARERLQLEAQSILADIRRRAKPTATRWFEPHAQSGCTG